MARRLARDEFVLPPTARQGMQIVLGDSERVYARHTHEVYSLGLIVRGGQRWFSGRGMVEALVGDVIMSNPNEVHDGKPLGDDGRRWHMLNLEQSLIRHVLQQLDLGDPARYEFTSPVVSDARLSIMVRRLFELATVSNEDLEFDSVLAGILRSLGPAPRNALSGISATIAFARDRIDDDPCATLTLGELARIANLSPWQFLRSFARSTGMTPHAYQKQRRLDLSRRLIKQGRPLAEAAAMSGFADQSHMTRHFRATYGMTPAVWATAMRSK